MGIDINFNMIRSWIRGIIWGLAWVACVFLFSLIGYHLLGSIGAGLSEGNNFIPVFTDTFVANINTMVNPAIVAGFCISVFASVSIDLLFDSDGLDGHSVKAAICVTSFAVAITGLIVIDFLFLESVSGENGEILKEFLHPSRLLMIGLFLMSLSTFKAYTISRAWKNKLD